MKNRSRLTRWGGVVLMLFLSLQAHAALLPDNVWYVFGDTVSLGFPRVTFTDVDRQITQDDYRTKAWGTEGSYRTENEGTSTYYFYRRTYQDTAFLNFSAREGSIAGEYEIVGNSIGHATTLYDLWRIVDVTPDPESGNPLEKYWPRERVRMRACNIATGQWIAYTTDANGEVVLSLTPDSTSSSPFGYYMDETAPDYYYYNDFRATSFLPIFYDNSGNNYFMYSEARGTDVSVEGSKAAGNYVRTSRAKDYYYKLNTAATRFMRCYQWTQENAVSLRIDATPLQTTFGYAKDDAAAQKQAMEETYDIALVDSANLYCVFGRAQGRLTQDIMLRDPVVVDDATTLADDYGIKAKFYWASNGAGSYTNLLSPLEQKQIDNTLSNVSPYNAETARTMMTRSEGVYNGHWRVTITPNGCSPFNIIDTTAYGNMAAVDYSDLLYCDVVDKDGKVLATNATSFFRKAYRQKASLDSIYVSYTPASPMLPASSGMQEFDYTFEEVQSEIRYTAAGVVDSIYKSERTSVPMKDLSKITVSLLTEDNQPFTGTWVDSVRIDTANSKIKFYYQANSGVDIRGVRLVVAVENGNYHAVSHNYIRQYTSAAVGAIQFNHQKGGYSDLMPANKQNIRYQRVHTIEKTIYYTSGEEIALVANEPNMRGYWRWYDYDSDLDPQYYWSDGAVKTTSNFWKTKPSAANSYFVSINAATPGASRGYYCSTADALPFGAESVPTKMIPYIYGWTDRQKRNIALDASAYQDFEITSTSITEPTLSYRQIWHFLPAEEMADSLMKCTSSDTPYEKHTYIAPTGQTVYLATNMPHYAYSVHASELSYYFYSGYWRRSITQVGKTATTAQWKYRTSTDGGKTFGSWSSLSENYTNDYQMVSSSSAQVVEYALYVPKSKVYGRENDLYIATFTVTYVSPATYGPSQTELMSRSEVAESYLLLAEQNFNFGTAAGSLSTSGMVFYPTPLSAENSSFGFLYVNASGTSQRSRQKSGNLGQNFPYYGEYCLVNQITAYSWALGAQHGGAANGYMMYVDGKMQPGLVTTISTDAVLCSGQQMYCYLWVCNPQTGGALPILRFDVQGRNGDTDEWHSVGSFFAGQIALDKGWMQVNFPVVSSENYAETRIAVYNFANAVSGNDFFIDDVCLYATKLPLSAYQAFTSCEVEGMSVAIARVDYSNFSSSGSSQQLYYTIQNTKADTMVHAVYHYPASWTEDQADTLGVIYVPAKGYDPTKDITTSLGNETGMVYGSANAIIDSLEVLYTKDKAAGTVRDGYVLKGYVLTTDKTGSRYILYVAHFINSEYTPADGTYSLNMAAAREDLTVPECAMTSELSILNKTNIRFGDGTTEGRLGACANGLYPVTIAVTNTFEIDGVTRNLSARAKADWLLGYAFDDVYDTNTTPTDAEKAKADAAFVAQYGYTRGKIQDALLELRSHPSISNYTATDLSTIVLDTIGSDGQAHSVLLEEHYNIISDLYTRGLLRLCCDSDRFYMRQQDTLRYWIFPIAGTAQASYDGKTYTLDNCSNRTYLRAYTQQSEHTVNLSPLSLAEMTDEQRHAIPRVRVGARLANTKFRVPIADMSDKVVFGWDSCQVVASTDPTVQALIDKGAAVSEFSMRYTQDRIFQDVGAGKYYKKGDTITFAPVDAAHVAAMKSRHNTESGWGTGEHPGFWHANTHTMRAGYEYTMCLTLLNQSLTTKDSVDASCSIGTVYFTVVVVPDVVIWTPMDNDYWGDDDNWHAIIDGVESDHAYAPLPETDVVLPTISDVRKYPYICDSVFYPMDANYRTAACRKILFQNKAAILNQHKLAYDSAYVDLVLPRDAWNTVSMPLRGVYSGDFFVPHSGKYTDATAENLESSDYFTVSSFRGSRDSLAAYAAWSNYYNDSVGTESQGALGKYNTYNQLKDSGSLVFFSSNILDKSLQPFEGLQLGIWGPDNLTAQDITIRLPKPDTKYDKFTNTGSVVGSCTVDRSDAYRLAFEPDANGQAKVKLHNDTPSPWFMWGNPTMSYVDAEAFFKTNSDKIEPYFKVMENGVWLTRTRYTVTYQTRFVKPYQAVLVYAKAGEKSQDLELTLDVNHLASSCMQDGRSNSTSVTRSLSPRRMENGHYLRYGRMRVAASVRPEGEMQAAASAVFDLVVSDFAHNGYEVGEDVPFFSTGITDDGKTYSGAAEMNLYSLVGTKGLSVDVREQPGIVPLCFLVSNDVRTLRSGKMTLYFSLYDWDEECYLVDAATGSRTRIINGTELTIDIPANHELRYYISGAKKDDTPTDNEDVIVPDNIDTTPAVSVYSPAEGRVNIVATAPIAAVRLYDVAGRLLTTADENGVGKSPVLSLSAPSGVLIAEVVLTTSKTPVRTKVFVQ